MPHVVEEFYPIDDVPLERYSFFHHLQESFAPSYREPLESIALQLKIINKDKVHIEEHELMDLKKIEPSQRNCERNTRTVKSANVFSRTTSQRSSAT